MRRVLVGLLLGLAIVGATASAHAENAPFYQTVTSSGTALTRRPKLNFVGATVTDSVANGRTTVTIDATSAGAVPTTRTVSTTSPLGGGGALSGNLTLTCTACALTTGFTMTGDITAGTTGQGRLLDPSHLGAISIDDVSGAQLAFSTSNFKLNSVHATLETTLANTSTDYALQLDESNAAITTAGATFLIISNGGGSATVGNMGVGAVSGQQRYFCELSRFVTTSGTVAAGDVVVVAGSDGRTVATAAATNNLTTLAGVAITGATTGVVIEICTRGPVFTNTATGLTAGQVLGSSTSAGGRAGATTPGVGAVLGRALDATNGLSEGANKTLVFVTL